MRIKDFVEGDVYRIQDEKNVQCCRHLHYSMEILIVKSGELIVTFENEEINLKKGEGILIAPYEVHGFEKNGDNEVMIIEFDKFAFEETVTIDFLKRQTFSASEELINYISFVISNRKKTLLFIKSIVYPILNECIGIKGEKNNAGEIFFSAISYIEKHFDENISLDTVAKEIGCSYEHLSRVFKKSSGMTFIKYVNRIRVYESLAQLKLTKLTITEIALNHGFETLRSYNREFKKILGMTPTEYRNNGFKDIEIGC